MNTPTTEQPTTITKNAPRGTSGYNPYPLHRKVRHDHTAPGHMTVCKTYSFTEEGTDIEYHPAIDVDGFVSCNCPDFFYRCGKHKPTVMAHPDFFCKHTIRAILGRTDAGEIYLPQEQIATLKKAMHRTKREGVAQMHDPEVNHVVNYRPCPAPPARTAPMTKEEIKRNLEAADIL